MEDYGLAENSPNDYCRTEKGIKKIIVPEANLKRLVWYMEWIF